MKEETHCEKCSYQSEEGLVISGCAYCGCHNKNTMKEETYTINAAMEAMENDMFAIIIKHY